jgi:hypothetical protein
MSSLFEAGEPDRELVGTTLEGLTYEEIALDWISRAASITRLDTSHSVITEGGFEAVQEVRMTHEAQLRADVVPYEHAEHRGQDALAAAELDVTSQDLGVREKTEFLASLANQIDPSYVIAGLDADEATKMDIKVVQELISAPVLDVLVGLRKYAEHIGGTDNTHNNLIEFQFLGLWAIYQAGKLAADTAK